MSDSEKPPGGDAAAGEPARLLAGDDAALRRLVEAGRSELPDGARLDALGARIAAATAGLGGDPDGGGGAGGEPGGGGDAGAAGGAGGAASLGPAAGAGAATSGVGVLGTIVVAGVLAAALGVGGASLVVSARAPAPGGPAAGTSVARSAEPAPRAPEDEPARAVEDAGVVDAEVARPRDGRTDGRGPSPRASAPAATAATTATAADDPAAEAALVREAQLALRADPARSLARADEHARRFPKGLLAQEREVIAVEALVALGRPDAARARAAAFRRAFPGSPHARRLDVLVPPP